MKNIKNLGTKLLTFGMIGAGLIFGGCKNSVNYSGGQGATNEEKVFKYEFTDFGELKIPERLDYRASLTVSGADLDGDGDIDIIAGNSRQKKIYLFENKIPQKNKE